MAHHLMSVRAQRQAGEADSWRAGVRKPYLLFNPPSLAESEPLRQILSLCRYVPLGIWHQPQFPPL